MPSRIAISMRVVNAQRYHDPRDALSQDWLPFLASCNLNYVLTPNLGDAVTTFLKAMDISGILLTGGNNVCPESYGEPADESVSDTAIERDNTESAMIQYGLDNGLPILGVCRGMHMINAFFGGTILTNLKDQVPNCGDHVACQHDVKITSTRFQYAFNVNKIRVNSYHNQGFTASQLAPSLECAAQSDSDGVVEAIAHTKFSIAGIQWHPERQGSASEFDRALVSRMLVEKSFPSSQSQTGSR